jgi:hypothetical protein
MHIVKFRLKKLLYVIIQTLMTSESLLVSFMKWHFEKLAQWISHFMGYLNPTVDFNFKSSWAKP